MQDGKKRNRHSSRMRNSFLSFPEVRARRNLTFGKTTGNKFFAIRELLRVDDTMLAYMIKEIAQKHSELSQTLDGLKHTDHSLQKAGFAGVKKLMEEDYAPSGHLIKQYSRDRCRN